MIMTSLTVSLAMAQAMMGGCGHKTPRTAVVSASCGECDGENARIFALIRCLQNAPEWRKRDNAAHDLAKFGGRRHPEVVDALALALMKDRHEEVREEAAESLRKIGPCTPLAHVAVTRAARCDPDKATRRQAAKALKMVSKKCVSGCSVCGNGPVIPVEGPIPPGILIEPGTVVPGIPFDSEPQLVPAPSPFSDELPPPPPTPSSNVRRLPPLLGPAA